MHAENIVQWPGQTSGGIEHGIVRGEGEGGYLVHGTSGILVATAAFSCLLKPNVGDKVLYTRAQEEGCYILSILERPESPDAVMSLPGDLVMETAKGRVVFAAAEGIDLTTANAVNVLAGDINLSAAGAHLHITETQATGERFTGAIHRVRLFSDAVDVVAQRVTQRFKSCFRWVEQIEQVSAGQMIQNVKNLFSVRARHSAITAESDTKIDGKRVHLG